MRLSSFKLCLLFKPNMCTYTSNKDQFNAEGLKSQPSDIIDIDSISIPNDFMNFMNKCVASEHLETSIESNKHRSNHLGLELPYTSENISLKTLIAYINNYIIKYFSSQEENYPSSICKAKNIIKIMYEKLSKIDFTKQSNTASNISDKKLKLSLIKLLKLLKHTVESDIFKNSNDLSEPTKELRLTLLSDLSKESIRCYYSFVKFLNETDKVNKLLDLSEISSLEKTTTNNQESQVLKINNNSSKNTISSILSAKKSSLDKSTTSNQAEQIPKENVKSLKKPNASKPSKTSGIRVFGSMSTDHLFTCKNPFENENKKCIAKSFCKTSTGIWYFAVESSDCTKFCILKINQDNFDKNVSKYEVIRSYSTGSNNNENAVFLKRRRPRKILINSSGILYLLNYSVGYDTFEILALKPNFSLIYKLDQSFLKKYGFEKSFIENFEIYDNLLIMYDSENKCIIVTDFDFEVKRIIEFDIKFKKLKLFENGRPHKNKLSLLVTEQYLYLCFNNEMYACENHILSSNNDSIKITGKVMKIIVKKTDNSSISLEEIVYVGNDSFISLPNFNFKNLIFTKLDSTTESKTCEIGIILIDYEIRKNHFSFELAAFEDHTVYLLEGGENIKLFKFTDYNTY